MSIAQTIRDNRATIICAAIVAAVVMGLWLAMRSPASHEGAYVALVHDGEGKTYELPLASDTQVAITTSLGTNVVAVEDGQVFMLDADCPNGTCLAEHPLIEPGQQIICLPHQLWIEVVPEDSEGGEMDVSLASDPENDIDLQAR